MNHYKTPDVLTIRRSPEFLEAHSKLNFHFLLTGITLKNLIKFFTIHVMLFMPLLISRVEAKPLIFLNTDHTILEADRHLVADGWRQSISRVFRHAPAPV